MMNRAWSLWTSFVEVANRRSEPTRAELDRLRGEVWHAVDELKAAGTPPERVIRFLKVTANDAGIRPKRHGVYGCLIPWFIERYYEHNEHTMRRS